MVPSLHVEEGGSSYKIKNQDQNRLQLLRGENKSYKFAVFQLLILCSKHFGSPET